MIAAVNTAITGAPTDRARKRNLIAAAYRTVGPDFFEVVKARFAETRTETNLLLDLRSGWRPGRSGVQDQGKQEGSGRMPADCGCPDPALLPGLIHCQRHRPRYDPTSTRRYDRRASNPDAARFFPRVGRRGPAEP
jgi:hypothetical protein